MALNKTNKMLYHVHVSGRHTADNQVRELDLYVIVDGVQSILDSLHYTTANMSWKPESVRIQSLKLVQEDILIETA